MASNDLPMCPQCRSALSFVGAWSVRDLWGYTEVRTYECSAHGPVFVRPQTSVADGPDKEPSKEPDDGDRDSLIPAWRKPTPTLNADSVAVPEPESALTSEMCVATQLEID